MKRALTGVVCLGIALVPALAAAGGGDSRQQASFQLTQERPGKSTSEHLIFDYVNPDDPDAKPPAVRRVVTILPRGARFDVSVPDSCGASDAELMARGAEACPQGSAVGGGVVTVDTGLPGPLRFVTADVEFFNNASDPQGELIYLNTVRATGARTVTRADARPRRGIVDLAMLPGTPPDGGAIDTVDVEVNAISRRVDGKRRHYITTPNRCRGPKSDPHWTTRARFTYSDGVTQTVTDQTPCRKRAS